MRILCVMERGKNTAGRFFLSAYSRNVKRSERNKCNYHKFNTTILLVCGMRNDLKLEC